MKQKKDITALYEVLHANNESQNQEAHRLYIFIYRLIK
ncbi:hypothetical protein MC5_02000 [Rickettsia australis str. Cutlack]|uniref:Uncharacterized protein n=1 Tax=Rickettsia australis (strain Cutlack) TaxID=1105110 RepID=H8K9R7_RICAC|nr:hypothetical protein MC5_02000 [Rickettsia australis str. Cutlack]